MNGISDKEAGSPARPALVRSLFDRYFARRIVYPTELPSIMRKHIYTGAMGSVWVTLISGILFVYFGTTIGISRFQWGLMGGLSSWLLATQLLSARLTERTGRRKMIWFWFAVTDRSLRLVGILVAFWLWHVGSQHAGLVLIGAICLANFVGTMASPPWFSWLADIIPAEQHGAFWGRRTAWIALAVIGAVVAAGLVADKMPPAYKVQAVVGIFVVATAIGLLDLVIHGTIPEPAMAMPARNHFWLQVLQPLRDRRFRPWLVFSVCWTFGMALGGALLIVYFLDELGIKNRLLGGMAAFTIPTLIGSLLTGRWTGRLVDRIGVKPVLRGGYLLWALLPAFWFLATPSTALLWIGASSLLGGVATTAGDTAATKLITRLPPAANRATYIAVSTSLGSLAAGFGAITAGVVMHVAGDWHVAFGPWSLGGFHLLFVGSLGLRFAAAIFLIPRLVELDSHRPAQP